MNKSIVLGAGAIGTEIFNQLKQQGKHVLLASKSYRALDDYIQIDALNQTDLTQKTKDISILYLCVGLPYNKKVWRKQWPIMIDNVIIAAQKNKFKIVFFDNVYMYGKLNNPVTEDHPNLPISHKGITRKIIVDKFFNANNIDYLIARSPDFFGPNAKNSILYTAFLENILNQKNPMFIGNINKKHSYAYTKDLAKAIILLSDKNKAYHQIWHLPSHQTDSINDILSIINDVLNTQYKIKTMPMFLNRILSIFVPILKEVKEMRYQFDDDYIIDDHKFMNLFPSFKKTELHQAIEDTINNLK